MNAEKALFNLRKSFSIAKISSDSDTNSEDGKFLPINTTDFLDFDLNFTNIAKTSPVESERAVIFCVYFRGKYFGEVGLFEPDLSSLNWSRFKLYILSSVNLDNYGESYNFCYCNEDNVKVCIENEETYREVIEIAKRLAKISEKMFLYVSRIGLPMKLKFLVSSSLKRVGSLSQSSDEKYHVNSVSITKEQKFEDKSNEDDKVLFEEVLFPPSGFTQVLTSDEANLDFDCLPDACSNFNDNSFQVPDVLEKTCAVKNSNEEIELKNTDAWVYTDDFSYLKNEDIYELSEETPEWFIKYMTKFRCEIYEDISAKIDQRFDQVMHIINVEESELNSSSPKSASNEPHANIRSYDKFELPQNLLLQEADSINVDELNLALHNKPYSIHPTETNAFLTKNAARMFYSELRNEKNRCKVHQNKNHSNVYTSADLALPSTIPSALPSMIPSTMPDSEKCYETEINKLQCHIFDQNHISVTPSIDRQSHYSAPSINCLMPSKNNLQSEYLFPSNNSKHDYVIPLNNQYDYEHLTPSNNWHSEHLTLSNNCHSEHLPPSNNSQSEYLTSLNNLKSDCLLESENSVKVLQEKLNKNIELFSENKNFDQDYFLHKLLKREKEILDFLDITNERIMENVRENLYDVSESASFNAQKNLLEDQEEMIDKMNLFGIRREQTCQDVKRLEQTLEDQSEVASRLFYHQNSPTLSPISGLNPVINFNPCKTQDSEAKIDSVKHETEIGSLKHEIKIDSTKPESEIDSLSTTNVPQETFSNNEVDWNIPIGAFKNSKSYDSKSLESHDSRNFVQLKKPFDAKFINEVSMANGTRIAPRNIFKKKWAVQNSGSTSWDNSTYIICDAYLHMKPLYERIQCPMLSPGAIGVVSAEFESPSVPGIHSTEWRFMREGVLFGDYLWCTIVVVANLLDSLKSEKFQLSPKICSPTTLKESSSGNLEENVPAKREEKISASLEESVPANLEENKVLNVGAVLKNTDIDVLDFDNNMEAKNTKSSKIEHSTDYLNSSTIFDELEFNLMAGLNGECNIESGKNVVMAESLARSPSLPISIKPSSFDKNKSLGVISEKFLNKNENSFRNECLENECDHESYSKNETVAENSRSDESRSSNYEEPKNEKNERKNKGKNAENEVWTKIKNDLESDGVFKRFDTPTSSHENDFQIVENDMTCQENENDSESGEKVNFQEGKTDSQNDINCQMNENEAQKIKSADINCQENVESSESSVESTDSESALEDEERESGYEFDNELSDSENCPTDGENIANCEIDRKNVQNNQSDDENIETGQNNDDNLGNCRSDDENDQRDSENTGNENNRTENLDTNSAFSQINAEENLHNGSIEQDLTSLHNTFNQNIEVDLEFEVIPCQNNKPASAIQVPTESTSVDAISLNTDYGLTFQETHFTASRRPPPQPIQLPDSDEESSVHDLVYIKDADVMSSFPSTANCSPRLEKRTMERSELNSSCSSLTDFETENEESAVAASCTSTESEPGRYQSSVLGDEENSTGVESTYSDNEFERLDFNTYLLNRIESKIASTRSSEQFSTSTEVCVQERAVSNLATDEIVLERSVSTLSTDTNALERPVSTLSTEETPLERPISTLSTEGSGSSTTPTTNTVQDEDLIVVRKENSTTSCEESRKNG